ncbi:polymeric immunoglobulin receptor-like [Mugil cephalus]|uniref:polymeric immunoglobulin receptor-like n=1 Tax=Mugil cephalus TaxID=48193 RepID=UPI001FB57E41|nr:polymeric immunoglobulin receptor-like [Mugil cephalus]
MHSQSESSDRDRMNLHQLLFFCFLPGAMCSRPIFTKTEGESLSFGCSFNASRGSRFFTKKEFSEQRVLIKTSDTTDSNGRYHIGYNTGIFYVSISQLSKSDSGHYCCGLGNSSSPELLREFELRVTEAMCEVNSTHIDPGVTVCGETEGGSIRITCSLPSAELFSLFLCKDGCKKQDVLVETSGAQAQRDRYRIKYVKNGVFHVTIANLTKADSALYSCGVNLLSAPNPCQSVHIKVTDAPATSQPDLTSQPCTPASFFPAITTLPPHTGAVIGLPSIPDKEQQTEESTSNGYIISLALSLTALAVLMVLFLVYIYKNRITRNSSNTAEPVASEYIECSTH